MQSRLAAIDIEFDVPATMRDGTVLRANVYRPAGEGQWPVLLTRLPYGKDLPIGSTVLDPVQAARRGYVVIVQDTRGTGTSEGEWLPFHYEREDGADTVAWAAQLPFSTGQVGMFGVSYFGFTQWSAALQQPPALKALAPAITWAEGPNGLSFRGGALELGTTASWYLLMELGPLLRRHGSQPETLGPALARWAAQVDALGTEGYWSLPLQAFPPLREPGFASRFFEAIESPMDPGSRISGDVTIRDGYDRVQVPTLNIGGWYDIFLSDTIANYQAMRERGNPARLLIGPWSHIEMGLRVGELTFGFGSQAGFMNLQTDMSSLQLRWFDHWLKGVDTGMLQEPPVRIFVMGANVWRDEQEWPLERATDTLWYLHEDGVLSREEPSAESGDRYDYDPANPVPTRGGALLMTPQYPSGPWDQRSIEARPDVLMYRSAPLERDVEVTGPVTVRLWACSSAPDTDFVARLVDIFPDGRSYNLTDGIVRARYRDAAGGGQPKLIRPGRPYEYTIDLWATSNVFKAGHRIGLHITSSNFPRWDRNPNTGHPFGADAEMQVAHQEILHDLEHPSHIVLPIVEGG